MMYNGATPTIGMPMTYANVQEPRVIQVVPRRTYLEYGGNGSLILWQTVGIVWWNYRILQQTVGIVRISRRNVNGTTGTDDIIGKTQQNIQRTSGTADKTQKTVQRGQKNRGNLWRTFLTG